MQGADPMPAACRFLPRIVVDKPWGRDTLPPPFTAPAGQRVGEIWFEPAAEMPGLLVKHIFTSEKLSVQVHPSDAQTEAAGLGRQGKEECWLVIEAAPGAALGVGFHQPVDAATLRAAALDGRIEQMLAWYPVQAGDFFYIPAGTVHAIGAGVSLIEVQQASNITYRLYDYGRPRELHLEAGLGVARGVPHDPVLRRHLGARAPARLVEGPYFRFDRLLGAPGPQVLARYGARPALVLALTPGVACGGAAIVPGQCAVVADVRGVTATEGATYLFIQELKGWGADPPPF